MESQIWTKDLSILVNPPCSVSIFPMPGMAPVDFANATARAVLIFTGFAYWALPTKFWLAGLVVLIGLFVRDNQCSTPAAPAKETFSVAEVRQETGKVFDEIPATENTGVSKQPEPEKVARVRRVANVEKLQEKAARGAKTKEKYLRAVFDDKDKKVRGFMINAREAPNRGEVVWSREQQIYNTRPYVKPSTDEYDSLWYGDVGPEKFTMRRA